MAAFLKMDVLRARTALGFATSPPRGSARAAASRADRTLARCTGWSADLPLADRRFGALRPSSKLNEHRVRRPAAPAAVSRRPVRPDGTRRRRSSLGSHHVRSRSPRHRSQRSRPPRRSRPRPHRRHRGRARHHPPGRHAARGTWKARACDADGDCRPRSDRHGRRQRCRRLQHLHPGRPELRHRAAVDAAAAGPGALRQPGDGAAPRRGDRRRPCAPDPGAVRQVLGRVQRHRPVHPERADHRHRVHRHQSRARLSRRAARLGHRGRGRHRSSPPPAPAASAASSGSRWRCASSACCWCRSS